MSRRRRKIVAVTPSEYTVPDKPCEVCDGEGQIDTPPITAVDDSTGERLTMVLSEMCPGCKGSGIS